MSPRRSRSDMTLRTEAGDSVIGSWRARLREPTGSPVARYVSTISRKIVRERSLSRCRFVRLAEAGLPKGFSVLMVVPGATLRCVVHRRIYEQALGNVKPCGPPRMSSLPWSLSLVQLIHCPINPEDLAPILPCGRRRGLRPLAADLLELRPRRAPGGEPDEPIHAAFDAVGIS